MSKTKTEYAAHFLEDSFVITAQRICNVVNLDQKGFAIFTMNYKIVMLSKAIIATTI